jgi:type II secretory pathway pseudopilin PulG
MAIVSAVAVILIIVLGFGLLGSPSSQRDARADTDRVRELYVIAGQIRNYSISHGSALPASLDQLPGDTPTDPITHQHFEYIPGTGSAYQLCATFNRPALSDEVYGALNIWKHPAGHSCFALDTKVFAPYPQE